MSKVVKKIGRAFKKVAKGIKTGLSSVWKKVKENKILKTIVIAAAVFVTGGMILGAAGGMAGAGLGSGFGTMMSATMQGAMAGIQSSWAALRAVGAAMIPGGEATWGQAGQAVRGVFSGAESAFNVGKGIGVKAAGTVPPIVTPDGMPTTPGQVVNNDPMSGLNGPGFSAGRQESIARGPRTLTGGFSTDGSRTALVRSPDALTSISTSNPIPQLTTGGGAPPPSGSLFQKMMSSDYTAPALILTGGNMLQGYSAARAQDEKDRRERERYRTNMGGRVDFNSIRPGLNYSPSAFNYMQPTYQSTK